MPARPSASPSGRGSAQPPKATSCMKSRSSDRCGCPFLSPPFSLRSGGCGPRLIVVSGSTIFTASPGLHEYNPPTFMGDYRVRVATSADADAIVRHRLDMFAEMGIQMDAALIARAFRNWLDHAMPSGLYRGWVVETAAAEVVAGGGITVLPWPPGPRYSGDRLAFVYNVYTEPAHRRQGLARMVMEAIHAWCRAAGISSLALNASDAGRPLYEALGYRV